MRQSAFAVCDDDMSSADSLEKYIKQIYKNAEIVRYEDADQLIADVEQKRYTFYIVFLGICMKKKNGITVAKEIRKLDINLPLVFTTASDQYYREAFDLFATQYLLKPVSPRKVREILNRLKIQEEPVEESLIHFRYRSRIHTLSEHEVTYISSSLHTVYFHLANGENLHCRGKLSDFEDQLKESNLVRCHQSFYVNLEAAVGMKRDCFVLKEIEIPISRTYYKKVFERYQNYLKEKQ